MESLYLPAQMLGTVTPTQIYFQESQSCRLKGRLALLEEPSKGNVPADTSIMLRANLKVLFP